MADSSERSAPGPRYPSAVDAWLVIAAAAGLATLVVQAVVIFPRSPATAFWSLSLAVLIAGFVGTLAWPCEYVLEADHLLVRSGLARWRIPYASITAIAPSRSVWSSPALSLRRVKVQHGRRFVLVSPRDREGFMAALEARVARARGAAAAPVAASTDAAA